MKLAAIYNIFDGIELLKGSMRQLDGHVDIFILVYQTRSNYGEEFHGFLQLDLSDFISPVQKHFYEPSEISEPFKKNTGSFNERMKRQIGINIARQLGCTHFLHLDCDEYYQDFAAAKLEYKSAGKIGSVCRLFTYFKKPTWRTEHTDNYYVPFIHQILGNTICGVDDYPFYVDPTRRINQPDVALLEHTIMHHFSYVRTDIEMKIRNSSARRNIERSNLLQEYRTLEKEDVE